MSGALTRILNNQIYSKTIIASQKIADGSITGSLFSSNVTVPGDLLISGNLFVLGSSSYTTIASTNTYVNDPLVVLNNGFSGTNSYDEGLIFNRGTSQNQAIIWSEYFGEFRLIATNETGTTYGNVNSAGLSRLSVGSLNVPGQANIGTISVTNIITTASLNVSGNVLASGGVFNALTVNGNETISGYINAAGNISTPQLNAGQINTTGNVLSTGAVHNALTVNGTTNSSVINVSNILVGAGGFNSNATVFAANFNTPGNVLSTGLSVFGNTSLGLAGQVSGSWVNVVGNITQTSAGGPVYFNTTGNVSAAVGVFGAINSTGYINTSGNISTPQLNAGQINTTGNVIATAGIYNDLRVNGNISAYGYINTTGNISTAQLNAGQVNTTGNVLATAGTFNALTVNGNETISGYINAAGNISTPQLNAGQVNTTGNVEATAGIFNALTVNGNESVTGYLNVTGNILGAQGTFSGITSTGYINSAGNVSTPQLNAGQINTTGNVLGQAGTFNALTVNGNETVTGYLNVTGNILGATGTLSILGVSNSLWANASIATTTQGTGAIVVPNGGISVAGAANIALTATIGGATQINNTLGVGGITTITNTTQATGASTGALQVAGGASFSQDVWIGGNLFVSNIIGVQANVITVQDPLLYLRPNVTTPYNYDIGFYSAFTGVGLGTINQYQHTSVFRDPTDNTWKFVSNLAEPSASYITLDGTTVYDPIKAGNLNLVNTTAATTTGTGALIVAGGAGIGGTLVAGQLNSTGNVLGQAATFNALTINGNETITGYLNVTGNVMTAQLNAGQINTTGNVLATAGVFNALTVNGNESVTGYLNVTGNILGASGTLSGLTVNGATTQNGTLTVSSGFINSSGNILATAGTFNALTVNGNESVTGYLNVTGNVMAAVVTASQLNTTGNVLATAGVFNALTVNGNESVTGYLNVTGNVMAAVVTASQLNTSGNVIAQNGVLNGLTVNGNETISGYINAAGNISTPQLNAGQINTTGNVLATAGVFNAMTVNGNESVTGYLNVTGNVLATRVDATVLAATGVIWANSTTDTTSTTTGAIITQGGISAAGNIYAGKNIYVGRATAFSIALNYPTVVAVDNGSTYAQMAILNTANTGSADYAAYSSAGNDTAGWADMGFTGNAFNDGNYTITKPNDGYFFVKPESSTWGGNLVLATSQTGNFNDIVFGVGSFQSTAEVMRFHSNVSNNGNAWLKYTTVSTTTNTGALRVDGGVGIAGNVRAGGGAVFNSTQGHDPFVVMGSTTTGLIYADPNNAAVTVGGGGYNGTGSVSTTPGASFKVQSTDSMMVPVGTTAQRPSGGGGNVDVAGMMRFNSTVSQLEFYDGSQWQTAGSVFTVISDRQFSGNSGAYGHVDGTNTSFTLQASSTTSATIVSINGVIQFPVLAYSVSGSTLTFTEPPAPDDVIDARVLATTTVVSSITSGNGLNQFLCDASGSQIWSGTNASGTIERINVDTSGNFNYLTGNKVTYTQPVVNIPTASTPVVIDTFPTSSYTTAKYIVQVKTGNTAEAAEILLTQDTVTPYLTTYGVVGNIMGVFSCSISSGNVNLYYTSNSLTNSNVKVMTTYIV